MRPEFCMVCNKTTQFNNAVYTARNIISNLERMTRGMDEPEQNSSYYHIRQSLSSDRQNISIPCGQCYKMNTIELRNLEDRIDELICKFISSTDSKNSNYHSLLRLLAGHYPLKYRIVERAISQKEKVR